MLFMVLVYAGIPLLILTTIQSRLLRFFKEIEWSTWQLVFLNVVGFMLDFGRANIDSLRSFVFLRVDDLVTSFWFFSEFANRTSTLGLLKKLPLFGVNIVPFVLLQIIWLARKNPDHSHPKLFGRVLAINMVALALALLIMYLLVTYSFLDGFIPNESSER